jgi:hypothetical protein
MIKELLCGRKASANLQNNGIFNRPIGYSLMVSEGLNPMSKTVTAPILFFGPFVIIGLSKLKFGP